MSGTRPNLDPATQGAIIEAASKAEFTKNLGLNLGGYILGLVFDTALLGVLCHQVIYYLTYAKNDRPFLQSLLVWVVTVSTATSFYGLAYIFHLFVYGFGLFTPFAEIEWLAYFALLDVLVTFPCQAFYLERAYSLNQRSLWVPILITPFMLGSFGGGLATMIVSRVLGFHSSHFGLTRSIYVWLSMTLVSDTLMTSFILYGLWRSRTGWSETDRLISKLVRISIQSQLPSTICALGFMITYAIAPDSTLSTFWEFWHPKCYVVSLMGVLNMRFTLRSNGQSSKGASSQEKSNTFALSSGSKPHQATVELGDINIDTDTYQESNASPKVQKGLNRSYNEQESGSRFDCADNTSRTGLTAHVPTRLPVDP